MNIQTNNPPKDELSKYLMSLGKSSDDYDLEGWGTLPFDMNKILTVIPGLKSIEVENGLLMFIDEWLKYSFSFSVKEVTEDVPLAKIHVDKWMPIENERCQELLKGMGKRPKSFLIRLHKTNKDRILLCKIRNKYFLCSGYHRVSVARYRGLQSVPAEIIYYIPKRRWTFHMILKYMNERVPCLSKRRKNNALACISFIEKINEWKESRSTSNPITRTIVKITCDIQKRGK